MKLLWEKKTPLPETRTVAAIGNFDGVHLGHQAMLQYLVTQAKKRQLPSVVMLFEPQPSEFFSPSSATARLSSLREKLNYISQQGVDYVFCLRFDAELANTSADDFAQRYIFELLNTDYLLVGDDFRFGKGRTGDKYLLANYAANHQRELVIFPDFSLDNERVSSTRIRQYLALGDLLQASRLLGRHYSMCGRVKKGAGRGRQWGIPTINLCLNRKHLALTGVFCVKVQCANGMYYNGVANIGSRPTVDGTTNVLEVNLFDFEGDLYGQMVQVYFISKLRNEIKFTAIPDLIAQIQLDIASAKNFFRAHRAEINATLE